MRFAAHADILETAADHGGPGLRPGQSEQSSADRGSTTIMFKLQRVATVLLAILREIFDESSYTRFLLQRGLNASPASYAAFLRDQEGIRARRPRCC